MNLDLKRKKIKKEKFSVMDSITMCIVGVIGLSLIFLSFIVFDIENTNFNFIKYIVTP